MLRRHNAERLELERNLCGEEEQALDKMLSDGEDKRNKLIKDMGEKLAFKLQGIYSHLSISLVTKWHMKVFPVERCPMKRGVPLKVVYSEERCLVEKESAM